LRRVGTTVTASIPGWDQLEFQDRDISHTVFTKGLGRGVIITHELPGMTPECAALGERVVAAGYRVFMPLLFGVPLENALVRNVARICISREFSVFQAGKTSPIVDWLRALCRKAWAECGGPGVGVIGMCLTGNFAITLLAEPSVFAPVTCQPTLPLGFSNTAKELAMSTKDLEAVKRRAQQENIPLLGFRFQGDTLCRAEKFTRIREELGERFRATHLPGRGHCTLTQDYVDEEHHSTRKAFETILTFLHERLQGESGATSPSFSPR
jgi:dienelactone hydrolase